MYSTMARPVPMLAAEALALLMLLGLAERPLRPIEIERSIGPRGKRFSIAEPLERLEDLKLVQRESPAPASPKYFLTDDGVGVLERAEDSKYMKRVLAELDAKVQKLGSPHPRDKSVVADEDLEPYKHLRKLITNEAAFSRGRQVIIEEEQEDGEDEEAIGELDAPAPQVRRGSVAWRQMQAGRQQRKGSGPTKKPAPVRFQNPRTRPQADVPLPASGSAGRSAGGREAGSAPRPKPRKVQPSRPASGSAGA